jgi:virulence-associated protein VapD
MFAIGFDLKKQDAIKNHPKGIRQAYSDIKVTLAKFDFVWVQGSLYTTENNDLSNLFGAILALQAMPWFPLSVRDIRAFKVELWSDFTTLVKSGITPKLLARNHKRCVAAQVGAKEKKVFESKNFFL